MSITRAKVDRFKAAAARFIRPKFHQIQNAAGLSWMDATDICAMGVKQGKIVIHDEDRAHIWLEVAQ